MTSDASTTSAWHARDATEVCTEFQVDPDTGLTIDQVAERRAEHGPNALPTADPTPWWRTLVRQFVSPLIAILFVAGLVTALQRHWVDTGAIFLALAVNATLGFWQERKAEHDIRALESMTTTTARVMRDGTLTTVGAEELVPGDIAQVESGDRIPADLRLLAANGLRVNESMLTGESLATTKDSSPADPDAQTGDQHSMAFSGTFVTSGRGTGVVIATGEDTQLGQISDLIRTAAAKTPLQLLTHRLERSIGIAVLIAVIFVFLAGLAGGYGIGEMFRTAVALAVGAVPESLPIILTVAMSVGVSRMARRRAIVRTLPSVETLGSTTVIASDKTGTLTQNRLTVERFWTMNGSIVPGEAAIDPLTHAMLRSGALTNEAAPDADGVLTGDAVDVAMKDIALRYGVVDQTEANADPVAHLPYEPALRYSQTLRRESDGTLVLHVKGSPDALVEMSDQLAVDGGQAPIDADVVHRANDAMAADGLRVIATAARVLDEPPTDRLAAPEHLTLLGLEGMTDPPREGVAEAIAACRTAGIDVLMVTGDHPTTAEAIALRLGMDSTAPPITGGELADLDDSDLAARLDETSVVARVAPADKQRIVRVLQDHGDTVAVTGDGVNDAPALKAASIGVAMGDSGTDVAREAADLVLTDDNFVTIVDAVEQGRVTFAAIRKATFFLLSTAVAIVLALSVNVLLDQPLLFLPVQILWINLVASGIQDIALAFEPEEGDELRRPPRPRDEGILSRTLWIRTVITGVWMGLAVLLTFAYALHHGTALEEARTLAMATFVLLNFFQLGNARVEHRSTFLVSPLRNPLLLVTGLGAIALLWLVTEWDVTADLLGLSPLGAGQWAMSAAISVSVVAIVEAEKLLRRLAGAGSRATTGRP